MTDKVQKIRKEVERLQDLTMDKNKNFYSEASAGEYYALCNIEHFIDSLQEEPVSDETMTIRKEWFEHCKKSWYNEGYIDGKYNRKSQFEKPVSEDLEKASIIHSEIVRNTSVIDEDFIDGAQWQKRKDEYITEDLGEYISELSKQFPEVSFAKLSRIAVRVAKWQRENLWKPADGDDLPEIDREVIALLDNGKVVFAHRPPEFWDGKNIITGKITRNYPKTYDKGGWNIPNVKYWLDCSMPKEIEL